MVRSIACSATLALVLSGCAGGPPPDVDHTPIAPTAVRETHTVNRGSDHFAAFESVTRTYSRRDMQRVESRVADSVAPLPEADEPGVRIERADRKLAWILDAGQKLYARCPLNGCRGAQSKKAAAPSARAGCRLRIGNTAFTIEPTGRKRSINGFDTEQYDIRWRVTFRDNASRVATSTVSIDLWATPAAAAPDDAVALEKAYARARAAALGRNPEAGEASYLPPEAGHMIERFLAPNISPDDRAAFLAGARQLDKVPGRPILTNVQWQFSGAACALDRTLAGSVDKPLFALSSEVKVQRIENLHDSLFAPPPEYKQKK
ncbi:MAG: hypothetical protein ABI648_07325 [Betaproteobacteria bacterium]|jgi:hypothetical protein